MDEIECQHGSIYVHEHETECLDCGVSLINVGLGIDGE